MNFLKFALLAFMGTAMASAEAQDYDHERLSSTTGKVYHEIFIIGSDAEGLTFRHRDGIAKLPFRELSASYRMLYEPVADLESAAEPVDPSEPEATSVGPTAPHPPVHVVSRSRVALPIPWAVWRLGGGLPPGWTDSAWPDWWPAHQRVHRLTNPFYREMVVRDFLHSSGLLPVPGCW